MSRQRIDWSSAACRDQDPELFFPLGTGEPAAQQAEAAKAVCARCALVEPCLDVALAAGITDGIWGGRTERERRAIARRRHGAFPVTAS